jgi:DNA-binding CsgD family transcriptional regulator
MELDHILARWIDRESRPRMLTDGDLCVHWISSAAMDLLGGDQPLIHRGGRLRTRDPRLDRALRGFLRNVPAGPQGATFCISDPDEGEHLLLAATRLQEPWSHLLGCSLRPTSEDLGVRVADLRQAFGLTPTEGRVTHHLIEGKTADQTAEDLGVSLDTVRTHIKRTYAKLGVCSREGLFHKLAPFVVALV